MKHRLAKFGSLIFHPVVFSLLVPFVVVYHHTPNFLYGMKWVLFSGGFLFIAILVFFLLRPVDFLTDFDISQREKRPIFYTTALLFAVLYFIAAILFKGLFFPLSIVALGIILGIVLFELMNFYIKASIHAAVSWGFVITCSILYGWVAFFLTIWIPFFVSWSRLVLKKHKKNEIIAGSVVGILVSLTTFAVALFLL